MKNESDQKGVEKFISEEKENNRSDSDIDSPQGIIVDNPYKKDSNFYPILGGTNAYAAFSSILLIIPCVCVLAPMVLFDELTSSISNLNCRPINSIANFTECNLTIACKPENEYRESKFENNFNFITTFNLYCETEDLIYYLSIANYLGILFGCIFFFPMMDGKFRKYNKILSLIFISVILYCFTIIQDKFWLYILFFLLNIVIPTVIGNSLTYIMEISSIEYRGLFGSMIMSSLPLSGIINEFLFIILKNWKHVFMIVSVSTLLSPLIYIFLADSPLYLISQMRFQKAKESLQYIRNFNKVTLDDIFIEEEGYEFMPKYYQKMESIKRNFLVIREFFSYKSLCKKNLLNFLQGIIFGILVSCHNILHYDLFLSFNMSDFFTFLLDILIFLISGFLMKIYGIHKFIKATVILSFLCSLIEIIISKYSFILGVTLIWFSMAYCLSCYAGGLYNASLYYYNSNRNTGLSLFLFGNIVGLFMMFGIKQVFVSGVMILSNSLGLLILITLYFQKDHTKKILKVDTKEIQALKSRTLIGIRELSLVISIKEFENAKDN